MAVDSYDSVSGRPIFSDTGAPDIGVDPTAVGIYAAEVGNRIVKANLAALNSYTYRRAGLMGHALDTKTDYRHNGTGWVLALEDTGWINMTLTNSWVNYDVTYVGAQYRRINGVVYVRGMIKSGSGGGAAITTLPTGFRPSLSSFQVITTQGGAGNVELKSDGRILAITVSATWTSLNLVFPADQ